MENGYRLLSKISQFRNTQYCRKTKIPHALSLIERISQRPMSYRRDDSTSREKNTNTDYGKEKKTVKEKLQTFHLIYVITPCSYVSFAVAL